MPEIIKCQKSRKVIMEMIVQLWRKSLLAFRKGNKKEVTEFNASIEKLKRSVVQIDGTLERLQLKEVRLYDRKGR